MRIGQPSFRILVKDLSGGLETIELHGVPNTLSGEKIGDTSQFEAVSDRLKGVKALSGSLETIDVRGKTFDHVEIGYPGGNEHDEDKDKENEKEKPHAGT